MIEALVKAGADPNARADGKSTPLHWAVWKNENPAVIEALLNAGADLAAVDAKGRTPFSLANESNESPAVRQALLAAGAERVEQQIAAARGGRASRSGRSGGLGAFLTGLAVAGAVTAAGGNAETALGAGLSTAEAALGTQHG